MFDPVEKKIHINRDVIFEEDKAWNWDVGYTSKQSIEFEWEDVYDSAVNEGQEVEDDNVNPEQNMGINPHEPHVNVPPQVEEVTTKERVESENHRYGMLITPQKKAYQM